MIIATNSAIRSNFSTLLFSVVGKIVCPAIFCLFLSLVAVTAQEPVPIQNTEDDGEALRVTTDLVQTDVMVFDRQGRFVEGLRPEQFEFRVDGKPQPISFFERVKAGNPDEEAKIAAAGRGAARENLSANLSGGRIIYFFLDDLHLQFESINRTRAAILNFIDNDMQLNDQVAIFTASGQLGILQQLSNEKSVLRAAVKRLVPRKSDTRDSGLVPMTEGQALAVERNDRAVIDYFIQQIAKELNRPAPRRRSVSWNKAETTDNLEEMVRSRARNILEQERFITRNTLLTLENLLRSSNPILTRKVFFLISDGFFVTEKSDTREQIKQITDAAARSGTVIYSLDARGVFSGLPNASERVAFDLIGSLPLIDTKAITASQESLQMIARETGGRAVLNTNKFTGIFAEALNETSDYYILAWQPDEETQKISDFRVIEASIKGRDDLTVRMRRGFYSESAESLLKNNRSKAKKLKEVKSPMLDALQSLYPRRTLPVSVTAGYTTATQKELTLTTLLQIDSRALETDKPEKTEVDIIGVIIDENGKQLSNFQESLTIDPSLMTKTQQRNIVYTRQTTVKPGIYQIRVAVRDNKRKRIGSNYYWIEVPDTKEFSIGSVITGEIYTGTAQAVINVNRRILQTSRFYLQTEIYNASNPSNIGVELQVFRGGKLIKVMPMRKIAAGGLADSSKISYTDDFSLVDFEPGAYVLQINAADRTAKKTATRQIDFVVE